MSHQTYTIYFKGEIADHFDQAEVKKRTQTIFALSSERAQSLFDGSTYVLKKGLSQQECEQFIKKLSNIGLIVSSTPSLIATPTQWVPVNTIQKPALAKRLLVGVSILVIGVAIGWLSNFMSSDQSFSTLSHPIQPIDIDESSNISTPQADHLNLIDECSSETTVNLLEKVLIQGVPQLIQKSLPNVQLTMQGHSYNQEVYFDPHRNKRLCGVISQYKVENSETQNAPQNTSITYEIIYEIEKKQDQSIKLSTFRLRVITPHLSENASSNTQDVEQNK